MRSFILLCLLALLLFFNKAVAQTKTVKSTPSASIRTTDTKERKIENDGFEWYLISKNNRYGAEGKNGKLIIPCQYDRVGYHEGFLLYGEKKPSYFYVNKGNYVGIYGTDGTCEIPTSRCYIYVNKEKEKNFGVYYECEKDNGFCLCDINGNEVCSISGKYESFLCNYESGKFYFDVSKEVDGEELYGIIDGNGQVIIDLKYDDLLDLDNGKFYVERNGNNVCVGYLSSIKTTQNPLANNPSYRNKTSQVKQARNTSNSTESVFQPQEEKHYKVTHLELEFESESTTIQFEADFMYTEDLFVLAIGDGVGHPDDLKFYTVKNSKKTNDAFILTTDNGYISFKKKNGKVKMSIKEDDLFNVFIIDTTPYNQPTLKRK